VSKFLPYGTQSIGADDVRAVVRALKSDRLTQGPEVERFEEAFAKFCGAPYAVAVSSGTAGLHLAALTAGLGPGDEAVTTPLTFAATANCVLYAGASPRFADVHDSDLGLDPAAVRKAVTPKTRALLPVHFAGQPNVWGAKRDFSRRPDFMVIEDACHALGAEVRSGNRWERIGSCSAADMAVFSFHPVKHVTTGEGGMVTTRDRKFYDRLRLLRSHGIERERSRFVYPGEAGAWSYEMQTLGFNYRITDIQCALGLSQLKKAPRFIARRREIASLYRKALSGVPFLSLVPESEGTRSSYHLFPVRIDFRALGLDRSSFMDALKREGIGTQVHYIPVPRQPYYRKLGFRPQNYPVAERFYSEALSIPMFPAMTDSDVRRVVRVLFKKLKRGVAR